MEGLEVLVLVEKWVTFLEHRTTNPTHQLEGSRLEHGTAAIVVRGFPRVYAGLKMRETHEKQPVQQHGTPNKMQHALCSPAKRFQSTRDPVGWGSDQA